MVGLFDLTSPVEPSKSKVAGTIMVEEISEELPEERTLVNFSPTGQFSPDPGHQTRLLSLPNKLAKQKKDVLPDFPYSWNLFLPPSYIF